MTGYPAMAFLPAPSKIKLVEEANVTRFLTPRFWARGDEGEEEATENREGSATIGREEPQHCSLGGYCIWDTQHATQNNCGLRS